MTEQGRGAVRREWEARYSGPVLVESGMQVDPKEAGDVEKNGHRPTPPVSGRRLHAVEPILKHALGNNETS